MEISRNIAILTYVLKCDVLITLVYIPLKLNEPVFDVSFMRILNILQWKLSTDFLGVLTITQYFASLTIKLEFYEKNLLQNYIKVRRSIFIS